MGAKLHIAACFGALVIAIPAVVEAKPIEREHYSESVTDTFTDTECGDPITIDYTGEFDGVFMLKAGRKGSAPPYFFDNYHGVETYTNIDNGLTATVVHQGLFKDVRIELVEGTVYKFTAIESGRPIAVYGPDGDRLIFDAGRIRYSFYVDTLGDDDLSNDIFLMGEEPSIAGPHPVFLGEADFCDLLDVLR